MRWPQLGPSPCSQLHAAANFLPPTRSPLSSSRTAAAQPAQTSTCCALRCSSGSRRRLKCRSDVLVQRLPVLHVCHTLQAFQCGCRCPSPHAICIASARLRCAIRSRKGAQLPPSQTPSRFLISCSLLKRVAAACTIVSSCRVTAAAARITQPAAADTAHAISHDGVVLVRGGCGCWHACI